MVVLENLKIDSSNEEQLKRGAAEVILSLHKDWKKEDLKFKVKDSIDLAY